MKVIDALFFFRYKSYMSHGTAATWILTRRFNQDYTSPPFHCSESPLFAAIGLRKMWPCDSRDSSHLHNIGITYKPSKY